MESLAKDIFLFGYAIMFAFLLVAVGSIIYVMKH